ncbi:MAG: phenylalanine--tRNA ligase subunit alpha [Candidatus Omnitrophica bacterium]|nr:phenylalanine--tRNA ligase subunit alpha [Candidatus Omnitrophota bacterium]
MTLADKIRQVIAEAQEKIPAAETAEAVEALRVQFLGRKGSLAELTGLFGQIDPSEKPEAGKEANRAKNEIAALLDQRTAAVAGSGGANSAAAKSKTDLTLPGTAPLIGGLHPITQVVDEICDIFYRLGFQIVTGPEMETDYYNFEALNIPADHSSRDDLATFYLENGKLLRSQTSTVQTRIMENERPPVKVLAPGRVYRPDATDATHSFMFHQIEGLCVDEKVSFADLKGVLLAFAKQFFGNDIKLRFRPHFFPFTEPSAEVDVSCGLCKGSGCRSCGHKGWLEILGAGMVHPNVLRAVKVNPEKYSGFAFGFGVERIAMRRWGVNDIRLFYENDMRFLRQFSA